MSSIRRPGGTNKRYVSTCAHWLWGRMEPWKHATWWMTFTFKPGRLPASDSEALRVVRGYLRTARKENSCKVRRWVATTDRTDAEGNPTRLHVHVLAVGPEKMLRKWWGRGRLDVKRIQTRARFDEKAAYFSKRMRDGDGQHEMIGARHAAKI